MIDAAGEILGALSRHRFRTAVTALSVAWGVFVLLLLLGAGRGLHNHAEWEFRDDAVNSVWIWARETSIPHEGHGVGRAVRLDNRDYEAVAALDGVEHISGRFYIWGNTTIRYGDKHRDFNIRSVHPDHRFIEKTLIVQGRFVNDIDQRDRRKVAVVGVDVAGFLFGVGPALGEWIAVAGVPFQVVGVFDDEGGGSELERIYLPVGTAQAVFGGYDRLHNLMFTVGEASLTESEALADEVRALLASRHHFSVDDPQAVRVRNNLERFQEITGVIGAIELFVWIVGIGTLAAGIVGVGNVTLVSVQERTREFGLRKAIGATRGSIVRLVLAEAVVLTSSAGYLGMVAGVGVLEAANRLAPDNGYFRQPEVDLPVAVAAVVLLVVFGALAGFFPAWRAARIEPAVALRD